MNFATHEKTLKNKEKKKAEAKMLFTPTIRQDFLLTFLQY